MNTTTTAATIFTNYYKAITDTTDKVQEYITAWISSENDYRPFWALIDALDADLRDLMHNANGEDLLGPDATDDEMDAFNLFLNTPDNDDLNDFHLQLASLIWVNAHTDLLK